MFTGDGLEFVVLTYIGVPLLFFIGAIVMIISGRKKDSKSLKMSGLFIACVVILGASIYFAGEIYKRVDSSRDKNNDSARFIKNIPTVYAPELSYIEKDFKTEKPELRAILYQDDAYEFTLSGLILKPKLRGFSDSSMNMSFFNPQHNICNFEQFFPEETSEPIESPCVVIAYDKIGNPIFSNGNSKELNAQDVYFGILKEDTLIVIEASNVASDYAITSMNNEQTQAIVEILSNLKKYDNNNLANTFHINASLGLSR